jgi:AcrR family transcriptional regulator
MISNVGRQATTRRAEIGRERRARMRGRLLEAAARVMADQGSDSATIDTFIRAAGVARGTFYNHFKTREE